MFLRGKIRMAIRIKSTMRPSAVISRSILKIFVVLLVNNDIVGSQDSCLDVNLKPRVCMPGSQNVVKFGSIVVSPDGSTCGSPASRYCRPKPRNGCFMCNASSIIDSHGPEKMKDSDPTVGEWDSGRPPTWWQSITWWDARSRGLLVDNTVKVNLTISMNKSYDILGSIRITFYSAKPNAFIIEKSTNFGVTWSPYRYFADDCNNRFGTSVPTSSTNKFQAICQKQSNVGAIQGSIIEFNPTALLSQENVWQSDIQRYVMATNIRIRLEYPWVDGGQGIQQQNYLEQYYYDVADIQIFGRCHCNGHAPYCQGPLQQQVCNCMHNTAGVDCERCLPLYNNKTWKAAESPTKPNPCEKCQCYDHAQKCVYNSTLGFGVCSDCTHNTTGFFCDKCEDKFFRNQSSSLNSPYVCSPCDCFLPGITNNGSCAQTATPNITIGQCPCEESFRGRKCDLCTDGYYGVTMVPIGVCKACNCTRHGTVNDSITCDQINGQCQCKTTVNGKQCSTCRDGYYNFPNSTDGQCLQCICDVGGAFNSNCNKTSGYCNCRNGITSMSCDMPRYGTFSPPFDHYQLEAESGSGNFEKVMEVSGEGVNFTGYGYARMNVNTSITVYFQPDFTGSFYQTIRYRSQQQPISLSSDLRYNNNSVSLVMKTMKISLPASTSLSPQVYSSHESVVLFANGNYSVTISITNATNASQTLDFDSVVMMFDFRSSKFYQAANETIRNATNSCWQSKQRITRNTQDTTLCKKIAFSVNTELFNGSLPCQCSSIGSLNTTYCYPYGGQCQCKPGVIGRNCDQCKPGYYNFTSNGCTACGCTVVGSKNLVCDMITGNCPCKTGVVNRTCSQCRDSFYGFQTGLGCRNCSCNWDGSAYQFCDENGICPCKSTTTGPKCDRCKPLHFNFTSNGCTPCNCDAAGSTNIQCDLTFGNCSCKQNVRGIKCNSCIAGTFNLQNSNPHGCQPCFCYNKTQQCSSAPGFYSFMIQSVFINGTDSWQFMNTTRNSPEYTNTSSGIEITLQDGIPVMLSAPERYLGQKLSSYAQPFAVNFTSTWRTGVLSTAMTLKLSITSIDNSVVVFSMPVNASMRHQTSSIRLHEINTENKVSPWRLQNVLSSIKQLVIQFNATNISRVSLNSLHLTSTSNQSSFSIASNYVEHCACPANFSENSCSACASGYTREFPGNGSYTNCKPCSCNSRSTTCNAQTGICNNCRIGTDGSYCERCQYGVMEPNCTKCISGFYGLNDTSFPGCRPCNCLLVNTIGGNASICNDITGQCSCRPNIDGRACDRCAENAINTTYAGCQSCPECYRLIQIEVHRLRRDIANITNVLSSVQSISQLTATSSFADRLTNLTYLVNNLTANARNSSSVESGLASELLALNISLDNMQKTLEQNVSRGINESNQHLATVNATRRRVMELNNAIYQLQWGSLYVMKTDIAKQTNQTNSIVSDLNAMSRNMSSKWNQYEPLWNATNEKNSEILKLTANATNSTALISSLMTQTDLRMNESSSAAKVMRSNLARIEIASNTLQTNLSNILQNITALSAQAMRSLNEARAMNVTKNAYLTQLQSRHRTLQSNLTSLNTSMTALMRNYSATRQAIDAYNARLTVLATSLNTTENATSTLARQARDAMRNADTAVNASRNLLQEAENMLRIVQNFNASSRAAENMAATSLKNTQEVNRTSMQAIDYTNKIKTDLDAASIIAKQSMSVAQNASYMASNVSQDLDVLMNSTKTLNSQTTSAMYKRSFFDTVRSNLSTSETTIITPRANECKLCTTAAKNAQTNATKAMQITRNTTTDVNAKQASLNKLMQDFQSISSLDISSLRQLQNTLRQHRSSFESSGVKAMVAQLQSTFQRQQSTVLQFRRTVGQLRTRIAGMKGDIASIASLTGCT